MNLINHLSLFSNNRLLIAFFALISVSAFFGCDKTDDQAEENKRIIEQQKNQLAADSVIITNYIASNNIQNVKRSPYSPSFYYVVETPGTGDSAVVDKTVVTHYTLRNLKGDILDTSRNPRTDPRTGQSSVQPLTFQLGSRGLILGYQQGVSLMRVGEKATFFLPSFLAYGTQGSGNTIPPNTVLIFDIELLEVR